MMSNYTSSAADFFLAGLMSDGAGTSIGVLMAV